MKVMEAMSSSKNKNSLDSSKNGWVLKEE